MANLLIGGGHNVERKWGWVIGGSVMYKVFIGCGENVGFLPINCPHFLCPAKVKQHHLAYLTHRLRRSNHYPQEEPHMYNILVVDCHDRTAYQFMK